MNLQNYSQVTQWTIQRQSVLVVSVTSGRLWIFRDDGAFEQVPRLSTSISIESGTEWLCIEKQFVTDILWFFVRVMKSLMQMKKLRMVRRCGVFVFRNLGFRLATS
jgi:hypothetical protein